MDKLQKQITEVLAAVQLLVEAGNKLAAGHPAQDLWEAAKTALRESAKSKEPVV
jgi:hypothetical protein